MEAVGGLQVRYQGNMKYVIGLSGRIGSGKTVVSDYINRNYDSDRLRFSQILMDILDRLYLEKDRRNLQVLGEGIRELFGEGVIEQAMEKDIMKSDAKVIVVDGIRYVNEVEMLRRFENSIIMYIDAPPEIRYQRVVARKEKGEGKISFEEFMKAENMGTERNLPSIMKAADHVFDNSGTLEDLYLKIDAVMDPWVRSQAR